MKPSDEVLIRQAVALSDAEAFGELVRRHQSRILLLQRRLTGERALAEDLAQETFLRAWQKLSSYRGSGSFAGWLARVSYNVFLQHIRRNRHQRQEIPLGEFEPPADTTDGADLADLERLLGVLEVEDQAIMVLNYAYGLSNTEVAEVVGMPVGTVKARIHRAKVKIREYLDGHPTKDRSTTSANTGRAATGRNTVDPGRNKLTNRLFGPLIGAYRS